MEAVVKSLDPNATSNRELVLDTPIEIIGCVVKTCVERVILAIRFLTSGPQLSDRGLSYGYAETCGWHK